MENEGNEIIDLDNSNSLDKKIKSIKNWFFKRVEKEVEDLNIIRKSERALGIIVVVVFSLIVLYFLAHQIWSTGFFTTTFGPLEMLMLYGSLGEWIVVAAMEWFGRKNFSRDIDAFGGIIFITIGTAWLLVIFPFEFVHFVDVMPESLRFLAQWISNDIARVLIALVVLVHLVAAIYYAILRVSVRKASASKSVKTDISE